MPYTTSLPRGNQLTSEQLPQHLEHKPVYAIPYEYFDGMFAGRTDTKYISIGLSQWDPDHVSIKSMRHPKKKWTRQAEELPLHRVIDMTLFLAKVLFDQQNGQVVIPASTFLNQDSDISITPETRSYGEMASYNAFLAKNSRLIKDRLNALADVLSDLREAGQI
jgi:hypothetical protein